MAKQTKEFSWDSEVTVKEISVNEYENRIVKVCELNSKQFVVVVTEKKIKDEWKPVKNATFPMDVWKQVVEAMGDYELQVAFAGSGSVQVVEKGMKPTKQKAAATKKKAEPKKATNEEVVTKSTAARPKKKTFDAAAEGLPVHDTVTYEEFPKLVQAYVHNETAKGKTVKALEKQGFIVLMAQKVAGKNMVTLERVKLRKA